MNAVIFDLDGVICFTDQYHYLAWKEMADEIGVYFDETINNRLRGVSRMDSLNIILEKKAVDKREVVHVSQIENQDKQKKNYFKFLVI